MKITTDYVEHNGIYSPTNYYIRIAIFWFLGIVASYFLFLPIWMLVAIPATLGLAIFVNGLIFWGHVLYHLTLYKITGTYHMNHMGCLK